MGEKKVWDGIIIKLFTLRFSLQDHEYLYRDINTRNVKPEYESACRAPVILYGFIHQSGRRVAQMIALVCAGSARISITVNLSTFLAMLPRVRGCRIDNADTHVSWPGAKTL